MKNNRSPLRIALIAVLCFADTACLLWLALVIRDEYHHIFRIEESVPLRRLWEQLKGSEEFWPFAAAALVISLILLLFLLFSANRKLALRKAAGGILLSASALCALLLLFFLLLGLPAVFDGIVPRTTVLRDKITILAFLGFLLLGYGGWRLVEIESE